MPQRSPRPTESTHPWPKWPPPTSGVKSWSQLPAGSMWFPSQHVDSGRWLSSHGPMDVLQRAGHAGRRSSGSGLPKVNNPNPTTCATRLYRTRGHGRKFGLAFFVCTRAFCSSECPSRSRCGDAPDAPPGWVQTRGTPPCTREDRALND